MIELFLSRISLTAKLKAKFKFKFKELLSGATFPESYFSGELLSFSASPMFATHLAKART